MHSKILKTILALAVSAGLGAGTAAPVMAQAIHGPVAAKPVEAGVKAEQVGWRYNGGRRAWYGPRGNWGPRRGYWGPGVAAGIVGGVAAGAIIAGSAAAANQAAANQAQSDAEYDQWLSYCSQKYKSFDPASGTYLNYDGNRYPCQ
jgi:hypothetical protein